MRASLRTDLRALAACLRDAWRLARPYFRSKERRSAWALLAAIVALNLALVGMDVVLNFWNNAFYTALQEKQWNAFLGLLLLGGRRPGGGFMPGFSLVAALYILVAVYRTYLNQWLQIRWRRWMTNRFLNDWLRDRAYYRIGLVGADARGAGTENPDQRIAEDLRAFTQDTLSIGLDLLSNVVSLFSFLGILWSLSGPLRILGIAIPGYMVWVALVYAALGSWLAHLVGRPLAALDFDRQRREADFRFGLARLRENAEGVALYGGEAAEGAALEGDFGQVVRNWWGIMRRTKLLNALTYGYNQVAVIFPFVVAAPRYFFGALKLGGLTQTASAFGQVQSAMSWFVTSYPSLASWRATVDRLATFERALAAAHAPGEIARETGAAAALRGLTLRRPDGTVLLPELAHRFAPGTFTAIAGVSGSGKSTLFRALAGLWPYGAGAVAVPERHLFLPQRPYLPLGTLRRALAYPNDPNRFTEMELRETLHLVGLGALADKLDHELPWARLLSGGEQQRLAIARALLARPDCLFMDEATSGLDPAAEATLLATLRRRLPDAAIVAATHRPYALADETLALSASSTTSGT